MSDNPSNVEDKLDGRDEAPKKTKKISREEATTARLKKMVRFCNSDIFRMQTNTFEDAIGNGFDPKMVAQQFKQNLSSRKAKRAFQANSIISIHNGDKLIRVVIRESFPFMCGLCGEAFHHTGILQAHVETKHDYYQDAVDHTDPPKKPIIIERDFSLMGKMVVPDMRDNLGMPSSRSRKKKGEPSFQQGQSSPVQQEPQSKSSSLEQEPQSQEDPPDDRPPDRPPEVPSDSESDGADLEMVSEPDTPSKEPASSTEDGVEYILTEMASQGNLGETAPAETQGEESQGEATPQERPSAEDVGATKTGSSSAPQGVPSSVTPSFPGWVSTVQKTSEKIQIIIPKQRSTKNKRRRMKSRKEKKEKYSLLNAEHLLSLLEPPKKKRRSAKDGDDVKKERPYCSVCNLLCGSRLIYKRHAAEAHNIFCNKEWGERALEERRARQRENEAAQLQDIESYGLQDQSSHSQAADEIRLIKCNICTKHVFDESTMVKHMRSHCGMPGIKCDICQEGIRLWENNQHEEMKDLAERVLSKDRRPQDVDCTEVKSSGYPNSSIIHTCHECNELFYLSSHSYAHSKWSHDKFTCTVCGFVTRTLGELTKHSQQTHKSGIYHCKYCPRGFHDQGKYNYHLKTHFEVFKCKKCGASYKHNHALVNHMKKHCWVNPDAPEANRIPRCSRKRLSSLTPIKACSICNKSFVRIGSYETHMSKAHNMIVGDFSESNRVTCQICGACPTRGNLISHMKIHDKKHACTFPGCTKVFPNPYLLQQHVRFHECAPTYICEDCGKTFQRLGGLRFHQRTHKERTGRCIFCSQEFKGRASLSRHMQEAHDHELSFSCGVCEKQFANRQRLLSHAQVHCNRPIAYICDKCPAAFGEKQFLEDHHQNFHNKLPYTCTVCNKAFRRLDCLKKHHLKEHVGQTDQGYEEPVHQTVNGTANAPIEVPGYSTTEGIVIVEYPTDQATDVAIAAIVNELQN